MSKDQDVFLIQPRDVSPSEFLKYKESKCKHFSEEVASQIKKIQSIMQEFRRRKEINQAIAKNIDKLLKRHQKIENNYLTIQNSFFEVQNKIYNLSGSLGQVTHRQNLINARNKIINTNLSTEMISTKIAEASKQDSPFGGERSGKLHTSIKSYTDELEEIRNKYFGDTKADSKTFFNEVRNELKRRKEDLDLLLNEIDQTNKRMFADSVNKMRLMNIE